MHEDPLVRYFRTLDAGDLDACIAGFADDATYSRPGAPQASDGVARGERILITIRGRDAIRAYLEEMRRLAAEAGMPPGWGPHELITCVRDGCHSFARGRVPTDEAGGVSTFLAHAEHDSSGRIVRYVALATPDPEG